MHETPILTFLSSLRTLRAIFFVPADRSQFPVREASHFRRQARFLFHKY